MRVEPAASGAGPSPSASSGSGFWQQAQTPAERLKFGAQPGKKIKSEPDLRGEPAASGAEKCLQGCDSQAVWSEATKEKEGLLAQAFKG